MSQVFDPVHRSHLFYDEYRYCVKFYMPEASCLRHKTHAHIDAILDRRIRIRAEADARWGKFARANGIHGIDARNPARHINITDETRANLHTVADALFDDDIQLKLVVSFNQAWVYTNEVEVVERVKQLPVNCKKFTKIVVDRPKNAITLRRSPHKFRSYLKSRRFTSEERELLANFLKSNEADIRVSPSLKRWIKNEWRLTLGHFFIDYSEPEWLTVFTLMCPGLIKKTYDIVLTK